MAKTEKELQELKEKIEKLSEELKELSDEELDKIAGGLTKGMCKDKVGRVWNPDCR